MMALYLVIQIGIGLEDGDEVLTTPLTCTATNWPILANNFNIKWVDIDPETLNMDLDDLARKITPKTKAIFVVHWGGYPLDLDRLEEIQNHANRLYGFKPAIIEDCAHAMGSKYKGKLIGTHGNICTFSLQAIKHITSGDGGLLFVPHDELYKRGKLLRWYGIDRDGNQ
jgi:dTDP-4-amino-4,6-dideoxy-D-glucose/dTDP-4-amino-2,4-dideoxy-beta-L-xylose transaminase